MTWKLKNGSTVRVTDDRIVVEGEKNHFGLSMLFITGLILVYLWNGLQLGISTAQNWVADGNSDLWTNLIFALIIISVALMVIYRMTEREILEVNTLEVIQTRFRFGLKTESFVLKQGNVVSVEYGVIAVSKYSSITGIIFQSPGLTIKAIPNVDVTEIMNLLDAFEHLGYPAKRDPALPMMLDIKKRGWFDFSSGKS